VARVDHVWHGGRIAAAGARAAGRGIVGITEAVVVETKRVTHVQFGTLRRSVHGAPVGYDGSSDEVGAATTDLAGLIKAVPTPTAVGLSTEVGSWLPYACAEWVGRSHPGVTQGLEQVRGARADGIMRAAFKAEGSRLL
jgi:hypothetical protein